MGDALELPLGKLFSLLAKDYMGTFSNRLKHLPISRYYYPLLLIHEAQGSLNQQNLADELQVDKVSVVRIVDYLSENNLLERRQNPRDRREQLLRITPAGEKLIEQIRQAIADTNELCLAGFTAADIARLETYLSRLSANLKQQPQDSYKIEFIKSEN